MAGHTRTVDTGRSRRTPGGNSRKVRQHLPPGEAEQARRDKERRGARTVTEDRIRRSRDPLSKLAAARDYVLSANAKYHADAELAAAVQALLDAGDRIYRNGTHRKRGR